MRKLVFVLLSIVIVIFDLSGEERRIQEGKKLYESKCSRCHNLYPPKQFNSAEWEHQLKKMAPLSGLRGEDESKVLDYLKSNADSKHDQNGEKFIIGGYLYSEYFRFDDGINTFDAHYLSISMGGRIHEKVTYYAEFELEHGGGALNPPFVEEAYLDYWINNRTALRIGAILTPFNKFDYFHGPLQNKLISRPQVSREIGVSAWKDVGVNLHGNLYLNKDIFLNYDLYLINGLGSGSRLRKSRQYKDNNNSVSMGFRLSGIFFDKLETGFSYYSGPWDDEGLLNLNMYGFHLLGKLEGLDVYGEYSKSISENSEIFPDGKADGFFVQVSYRLKRFLRATLRYGTLDYLDIADTLGRSFTDIDKKVLAIGINYYLNSSVVFKAEYDFVIEGERAAKKDNNILAFQAAVAF